MKKLLVALLVVAMMISTAMAEGIDLSGLSYEDLLELRQQVDAAIWASDGWQEVKVPAGVYVIGEDIPSGRWSVTPSDRLSTFTLFPTKADYTEQTYNYISLNMLDAGESYALDVQDGQFLEIGGGALTFTPYIGAALGFK